ncbi:hypothetical protein [Bacillus atrophaeus]|uniref:hypothetical protein n=1 Tax=Bacillus atrophaeus TaxID=1452 RepID=UPI00227E2AD3|nr:hypothetical protein [Bacillus atrophaeus]MCY8512051.1 hypothetical protein [Bacillus atrophaeus]MCY8516010.1 hypothetical protein [Bacillus atrophaeus]MCY9109943.1 hypothetical protein [Bacillus atrophaeus]
MIFNTVLCIIRLSGETKKLPQAENHSNCLEEVLKEIFFSAWVIKNISYLDLPASVFITITATMVFLFFLFARVMTLSLLFTRVVVMAIFIEPVIKEPEIIEPIIVEFPFM